MSIGIGTRVISQIAIFCISALAGCSTAAAAPERTPIASIHHGNPSDFPADVVIQGAVTQIATRPWGFTVQDGSDGIFVALDSSKGWPGVDPGDLVRVTGRVTPGQFAPILYSRSILRLGRVRFPAARRPAESELSGGTLDNLYIEIRGTVRAVANGAVSGSNPATFLILDTQDRSSDSIEVVLNHPGGDPLRYVDASIVARGVTGVIYNSKHQATGLRVLVSRPGDIRIVRPPEAGPFSIPPTPIGDVLKWNAKRDWSHRIRVEGTVTLDRPGEYAILQDGGFAIRVDAESHERIAAGARAEATGFVSAGGYSPSLRNSVIRSTGSGRLLTPLRRSPRQLLSGEDDDLLITTTATVLDTGHSGRRSILTLAQDGVQFEAEAPAESAEEIEEIQRGARVEITGICQILPDALRSPRSLQVLLRSADDIRILNAGPAVTMSRLIAAGCALAATGLLFGLWALMLRRRVREQTKWIRTSLEREHCFAGLMAQRSAILESVGRNEPLETIFPRITALAETGIPEGGASVRIEDYADGPSSELLANSAAVSVCSGSGRLRATLTLARQTRSERENDVLRACRECLAIAIEHRDLQDRLIEQSLHDPLTQLPNRRSLEQRFHRALDDARQNEGRLAVLALDLDSFKQVNDTLGHAAGDAVLQTISARFRAVMRSGDLLARVGGDEFLALLPGIAGRAQALEIAERLTAAASAEIEINGIRLTPSVSLGAAFYPDDGEEPDALRNIADLRMYEQKMNQPRMKQTRLGGMEPAAAAL